MREIKLLPCPFCGGEAKVIENNCYTDIHSVMCKNCFSESDRYHTQDEAIKQWNIRKPMQEIVERLEGKAFLFPKIEGMQVFNRSFIIGRDEAIEIVKEVGGMND